MPNARALILELIATHSAISGPRSSTVASNRHSLGVIEFRSGNFEAAAQELTLATELAEELDTPPSPNLGKLYKSLAKTQLKQGRFQEAMEAAKRAVDIMVEAFGQDSEQAQASRALIELVQTSRKEQSAP